MTFDFVEKAKEAEPVAVITEATNMTEASVSSDAEVEGKSGYCLASKGFGACRFCLHRH